MILPPSRVDTKKVPTMEETMEIAPSTSGKSTARLAHVDHHQAAEQHGRDQRDGVGLEQVGRHAGAVADVVADVVGDHRRVARIVLGNAGFDLADQVGADVGALGENAAAQAREDRDQRAAEGEADQRAQCAIPDRPARAHDEVVAGDAEQAQAHHQHAGDGAAAERNLERRVDAVVRGLRGAHVGAHRDVHADVARRARRGSRPPRSRRRWPSPSATPSATNRMTPTIAMVVYCRFR